MPWKKLKSAVALMFLTALLCVIAGVMENQKASNAQKQEVTSNKVEQAKYYEAGPQYKPAVPSPVPTPTPDPSEAVYAFLQGPKAWKEKRPGAGVWGKDYYVDGTLFSNYGCGLCCLANIYSTFTPYECSPLDMYEYAKKASGYPGCGPIDWEFMQMTLEKAGFQSNMYKKPDTYQEFQNQVKNAMMSIMLISSSNSSDYWKDTYGHYITISLYDEANDTVFLGDSSHPDNNRKRIPLKTVYKALKTASKLQCLSVTSYEESLNTWKKDGITHRWIDHR